MRGVSKHKPAEGPKFLVHQPTNHIGLAKEAGPLGGAQPTTIKLANGEVLTAPSREFYVASGWEIEEYHRLAALIQPFTLPNVPRTATPIYTS